MPGSDACACSYVQREIIGYLRDHPRACDTIEGIVQWWILEQRQRLGRETVEQALQALVNRGEVVRSVRGGVALYAAARSREA